MQGTIFFSLHAAEAIRLFPPFFLGILSPEVEIWSLGLETTGEGVKAEREREKETAPKHSFLSSLQTALLFFLLLLP